MPPDSVFFTTATAWGFSGLSIELSCASDSQDGPTRSPAVEPAQNDQTATKTPGEQPEANAASPAKLAARPAAVAPIDRLPPADAAPIVPDWAPGPPVFGATYDGNTMICVPLRSHERSALVVLHRDGPLSIGTLWRRCKVPKKWQQETLYDLHRMGYVTVSDIDGPKRQRIIAATDRPVPPAD